MFLMGRGKVSPKKQQLVAGGFTLEGQAYVPDPGIDDMLQCIVRDAVILGCQYDDCLEDTFTLPM